MSLDPALERILTLAAEAAVRGRKQWVTAEDIRQELRVQLLDCPELLDAEPPHLYSQLRWFGTLYAKAQQAQCEGKRGKPATGDRWDGLKGMTGADAAGVMLEAGYRPEPDDLACIVEAVDARMDWQVLGISWGVSGKAAYTRFRRASERVVVTRGPINVRENGMPKEKNADQPEAGEAILVGGPDDGLTLPDPGDGKVRIAGASTGKGKSDGKGKAHTNLYRRMSFPDAEGRVQFAFIGKQGSNTAASTEELDQPGRDRDAKMGIQEVAEDPTITAIRNVAEKAKDATGPEVDGAQAADLNVASKELQSGEKASSKGSK